MISKALSGSLLMLQITLLLGCAVSVVPAVAEDSISRPELRQFIQEMAAKYDFDSKALDSLFAQAQPQPAIITAISSPAEAKPWYQYRPIFVNSARIEGGAAFWQEHKEVLEQAERIYGVPPEIIVAIIGVETRYGKNTGSFRVLDALATLAFDYPARGTFFRKELEQYLLLTREEGLDPLGLKGSYAGAMGKPQFIPSSYRHYAVDFDGDGRRDLWNNNADVIGSVANYFKTHGWKPQQPVIAPARIKGDQYKPLLKKNVKPQMLVREFAQHGVSIDGGLPPDHPGMLIELETEQGPEYWVGLDNFYVITRYNRSPLYAMAVYQLSREILATVDNRLAEQR